ncbi:MAG TPA: imidazole glycerol phosphate synthase subunit HisH [Xanthomonadales bacterium]|nr:imidazole glycerol phosphate synthase subunit HisH [Xanthomonadales bacterium]
MNLVLVDSGGANIGSVRYALARLGVEAPLTADHARILAADRVILPGVGAAGAAMAQLRQAGLIEVLRACRQPLLGICLGMQLLFESSEEGEVDCLGLLPGRVARMPAAPGIRIPHMGWNRLQPLRPSPLLAGIGGDDWAYFVHGYAAPVGPDCVAACDHGEPFAAVVQRGRVMGAQFHPERSAATGLRILRNFLEAAFEPAVEEGRA